jgi:hypothetical protein
MAVLIFCCMVKILPHPDSLPKEREQPLDICLKLENRRAEGRCGFAKTRKQLLSPPAGKGRDEGERAKWN